MGMLLRMLCSSSTSFGVSDSVVDKDLGTASCNPGLPSARVAELMFKWGWFNAAVTVKIAEGVGGANPPAMPAPIVRIVSVDEDKN